MPAVAVIYSGTGPNKPHSSTSTFHDHFPQPHPYDYEDSDTDIEYDDDEDDDEEDEEERLQLPPLPVVRLSASKLAKHNFATTTRHVPRLRFDRASPISGTTARSGKRF